LEKYNNYTRGKNLHTLLGVSFGCAYFLLKILCMTKSDALEFFSQAAAVTVANCFPKFFTQKADLSDVL